jgi:hypothetical protein
MKLMTGVALVAAVLAGTTPAEAQSFQNLVETFYDNESRTHPIAATSIGVHDYDAEVDDLSRDGQAKNSARLAGLLRKQTRVPLACIPTEKGYIPGYGIRDTLRLHHDPPRRARGHRRL